jgi:hypothetical protein
LVQQQQQRQQLQRQQGSQQARQPPLTSPQQALANQASRSAMGGAGQTNQAAGAGGSGRASHLKNYTVQVTHHPNTQHVKGPGQQANGSSGSGAGGLDGIALLAQAAELEDKPSGQKTTQGREAAQGMPSRGATPWRMPKQVTETNFATTGTAGGSSTGTAGTSQMQYTHRPSASGTAGALVHDKIHKLPISPDAKAPVRQKQSQRLQHPPVEEPAAKRPRMSGAELSTEQRQKDVGSTEGVQAPPGSETFSKEQHLLVAAARLLQDQVSGLRMAHVVRRALKFQAYSGYSWGRCAQAIGDHLDLGQTLPGSSWLRMGLLLVCKGDPDDARQ